MADSSHVEREVVELHQFFQDWFNGQLDDTDDAFARFDGALAPGFVIVGPDGGARGREDILRIVRESHSSAAGDAPIRIWIEDVHIHRREGDLTFATYEEWQERAGEEPRGRISTVVFKDDEGGPNALRWLHVHETWLATDDG